MRRILYMLVALAFASAKTSGQCQLPTIFATNGGGSIGGAMYFDVTVQQPIQVTAIDTNTSVALGTPIGCTIYLAPGSWMGSPTWTQVAIGAGTAMPIDSPSHLALTSPIALPPGSYGLAIVASGPAGSYNHRYTNGNGSNQLYVNTDLQISLGAASNVPFGGSTFQPRVWNGAIHYTHDGGSFALVSPGCGSLLQTATGNPNLGGAVSYAFGPATGTVVHWIGIVSTSIPLCSSCNLGTSLDLVGVGPTLAGTIPCDPALIGGVYYTQAANVGGAGGCSAGVPFTFPVSLSDTYRTILF